MHSGCLDIPLLDIWCLWDLLPIKARYSRHIIMLSIIAHADTFVYTGLLTVDVIFVFSFLEGDQEEEEEEEEEEDCGSEYAHTKPLTCQEKGMMLFVKTSVCRRHGEQCQRRGWHCAAFKVNSICAMSDIRSSLLDSQSICELCTRQEVFVDDRK